MDGPLNPGDAVWVGIGTTIGVVATAFFGWFRVRRAGLTDITLKEMAQRDQFMTMLLARLKEVEDGQRQSNQMVLELMNMLVELRNEEEAEKLERRENG